MPSPLEASTRDSARQLALYIVFGLCQLGIDWAVFVGLTFAGLAIPLANITSRLTAAITGYFLNGAITFKDPTRTKLGRKALIRFLLLWVTLTAISTLLIALIEAQSNLGITRLAKPVVEAFLAGVSFLAMKFWVYR